MAKKKEPQSKFKLVTMTAKKNLTRLREASGYTLNEISRSTGITRKTLEDIETLRNYGRYLDLESLVKLTEFYDVTIDDLLIPS